MRAPLATARHHARPEDRSMTAFALTPRTLTAVLLLTVAAARPARA
ncbi:MAG: hypothetical protein IPJ11_00895 [Gemmatimonadetes bacterium]|nr:hypothetical protein [Gemmatimonadota bacterium]